ncbi:unnamed protein product [Agarophyton chilense]
MTDTSSRLARWRLRLSEYDYEITYRPGIKQQEVDDLSRIITNGNDDTPLGDLIPTPFTDHGPQGYTETDNIMGKVQSDVPEAQVENEYSNKTAQLLGTPGCLFDYDRFGLMCRRSPLNGALEQDITERLTLTEAKRNSRRRIDHIIQSARAVLTDAQRHYKFNFNKAVWNTPTFEKKDLVYLDRSPKDSDELEDTTRKL